MFLKTLNETIMNVWPQLVIFIVILSSLRIVSIINSGKHFVFHEEFMNLLSVIYILLLFELLTGTENATGSGFNLIPFGEILRFKFGSSMFIYTVVGNILLFVPFGYFVSRYTKPKKILQVLILAIVASTTIELMQLNIGRTFDIDDIFLNVIGAILGYFIYISFNAIKSHLPSILQKDFIYNIISFIILIIIIIYMLHLNGIRWLF